MMDASHDLDIVGLRDTVSQWPSNLAAYWNQLEEYFKIVMLDVWGVAWLFLNPHMYNNNCKTTDVTNTLGYLHVSSLDAQFSISKSTLDTPWDLTYGLLLLSGAGIILVLLFQSLLCTISW